MIQLPNNNISYHQLIWFQFSQNLDHICNYLYSILQKTDVRGWTAAHKKRKKKVGPARTFPKSIELRFSNAFSQKPYAVDKFASKFRKELVHSFCCTCLMTSFCGKNLPLRGCLDSRKWAEIRKCRSVIYHFPIYSNTGKGK